MLLSSIFGMDDLWVVLIALVVLFGGTQLPKLARNTGEALKEFRKAHTEADSASSAATAPATAPAAPALPVTAQTTGVAQVVVPAPAASDTVTLTQAQLDAIVAARVAQSQPEGPKAGS